MAIRRLNVFLHGSHAGVLTGSGTLIRGFQYARAYDGPALSASLPRSKKIDAALASAWFDGLLPEGRELRLSMAEAHGSRDTTTLGLLEVAGLDCAGAVQLTREHELPDRAGSAEPITDAEIGMRLRAANQGLPARGEGEHWSVAGQQGKIALHRTLDDQWARPLDGLATTHILKPGIENIDGERIRDQALIEHLTMTAAARLGLRVAATEYVEFDGTPSVVVTRFDRIWIDGECTRIHQEDACQALGLPPEKKYEDRGGPSVARMADLIAAVHGSRGAKAGRLDFARMAIFNYLSGSPDAHAKNYSFLHLPGNVSMLAPMYDAASGFGMSYPATGSPRFTSAAMKIGAHEKFGHVSSADWQQFARDTGTPFDEIRSSRDAIARHLPDALRDSLNTDIPSSARRRILASPLLERVQRLCADTLALD